MSFTNGFSEKSTLERKRLAEENHEKRKNLADEKAVSTSYFLLSITLVCLFDVWGYRELVIITCAAYAILAIIKVTGADFAPDTNRARRHLEKLDRRAKMEERARRYNVPGSLWRAVFLADRAEVLRMVRERPEILQEERAEFGETPLLLLFLFNRPGTDHLAIAKELLLEYPLLVSQQYQVTDDDVEEDSEYHGENCLHIAIAKNRDYELVKFVLDVSPDSVPALLSARANGRFFRYGQTCYFGETPLNFAVAANHKGILRLLVNHGAKLDSEDSNGNNCLHIAVHHGRIEMWDELVRLWEEKHGHEDSTKHLGRRKNFDGMTPLTYAAKHNRIEMFRHILESMKSVQWKWGPVTNHLLPLIGGVYGDIDYVEGAGTGAVEHIIREGSIEMLMIPDILDLMERKWDIFGYRYFHQRFMWAFGNTICLTMMILQNAPESGTEVPLEHAVRMASHYCCKAFVWYFTLGKLRTELQEIWQESDKDPRNLHQGIVRHFEQGGSMFFENCASLCFCMLFLIWQILEIVLGEAPAFAIAFTCLFGWAYMLWFMLGFNNTGHLVIMVYRILSEDMARFACMASIFLFGFALITLVCQEPSKNWNVGNFMGQWVKGFNIMTNGFEANDSAAPEHQVIHIFFSILVSILLLNMLIAMMGDTYAKVCEQAEGQWRLERARIIMSIEQEMTPGERDLHPYWVELETRPGERLFQIETSDESWAEEVGEVPDATEEACPLVTSQPLDTSSVDDSTEDSSATLRKRVNAK